ncbi:ATPase synthesis protein 25, mitochondrial [Trichoderma reesei RUT C-30]|uniref:ATPase synthesis protein 25 n=1 Tax=Hypocrea jecorina (strain ATCC 56765 / BCRC 32924 / NRRL 11460 / Rut C-30) TaxID=1344414 RepID=A0A024S8B5_HYPJR|nr:ATPase synthesis protein 25, mitochondrial [Trichoderma reesei RUT C-30]
MISRPVAATLGCCGCRQAILRAVASRPLAGIGQSASRGIRPVASSGFRGVAASQQFGTTAQRSAEEKAGIQELRDEEDIVDSNEDADTPWFLDVEPPRRAPLQHIASLPKVPEDAPPLLEPMMKYIYEDMGLDELSMLDLRELDPPAALGPNLIMIFGTARSERHLHISAGRFVRWLRKNHQVGARADGLIGPGELKTKLRRLRKKAKMLGTNTMIMPGSDNGISTGWVCVNFSAHDHGAQESHSYDESGRFSGFGTPLTGTTVVVQCMTESRRNELDLETLWRGILKRNMEEMQKVKGRKVVDPSELESMVSAKIQMPDSPSAQQWQALKLASQQQRQFSTMARRLQAPPQSITEDQPHSPKLDLSTLRRHIHDVQVAGTPVSRETFQGLISAIFQAEVTAEDTAPERLALVDQLSLMAEERGVHVTSKDWLISLIETIVTSPAYGPELQRAQKNVEYLLSTKQTSALKTSEILRLMAAYAHRSDWDKFWDAFRSPARFLLPRSPELYEYAYRVMAATGDRKLCTDALRWVYPEMLKEEPKIWPVGSLYTSLKACILAADPSAENLLHHPPPQDTLDLFGQRQLAHREFVRVLREVETMRQHYVNEQAREHSAQTLRNLSGQMPSSYN